MSVGNALSRFGRNDRGNIAIMAAVTAPFILYAMSLGLDYGMLTLQQRELQETADLSAIVAASDVTNAQANILNYFATNNLKMAIQTSTGYVSNSGTTPLSDTAAAAKFEGIATMTLGTYVADPTVALGSRFVSGATPYDAVKVAVRQSGGLVFAATFAKPPTLQAVGTASTQKVAAFSIGSGLAGVNNGLLNALLGGLLGTTLSLSAMDYNALLSTNVNALSVVDTLATNLSLTAGSYSDVLAANIKVSDFLNALGGQTGLNTATKKALQSLQTAANSAQLQLNVADILSLGPTSQRAIRTGPHLSVTANVMELITAAALAANGSKQVSVNLGGTIPGLSTVQLTIAVGEPPQSTPSLAVGSVGTVVRTAQTRIKLQLSIDGLAILLGTKIQLPLYVQLAAATGRLSAITCLGNGAKNANVSIDTTPGFADLYIGDVDTTSFSNFATSPSVTPATLVNVLSLITATASAHVSLSNMTKTTLVFSMADIAAGTTKTASTTDTLTSAVSSLLGKTTYSIRILFITLNSTAMYQQALAQSLAAITAPLDDLLSNILLLVGVKIGQADVTVTDVSCQQPALVQ
jgi:uncharacterized membrane protein